MNGQQIREQLHGGANVYGTHVASVGNPVVTRLLGTAPLDFVFICNEHMPLDRAETSALCQQFGSMNWILDGTDVVHALHSLKQRRIELGGAAAAVALPTTRKEISTCIAA